MGKRALVTGVTGQDGMYLSRELLAAGYEVFGLVRGQQNPKIGKLKRLLPDLRVAHGDLLDQASLICAVENFQPDEIYNLGAVSYVPVSWQQPALTTDVTGIGPLRILEAIRIVSGIGSGSRAQAAGVKFYQASTSEMFGMVAESPQSERTPLHPRSPYGVAKAYGHHITQNYRESYGIFAVSGILFNHESPFRGSEFVTRKVSIGAARIALGLEQELPLGNLDARRDWGFAGDYVKAMKMMLDTKEAEDYVIGTGVTHSVRDLARVAFECVGLDWEKYVVVDRDLLRPADVELLCADASKARERLGWVPETSFEEVITSMVEADLARLSGDKKEPLLA
ncbi:GDP-mannose 4,6-dehydratase [Streptomyces sp. NPDC050164]|uniref:GDP-mannose 4,6-dehydratase n=1 Tax=Streptomyces sp. NPDC050164 TaxID=3365605 RepID=UPI00379AD83A